LLTSDLITNFTIISTIGDIKIITGNDITKAIPHPVNQIFIMLGGIPTLIILIIRDIIPDINNAMKKENMAF